LNEKQRTISGRIVLGISRRMNR